MFCRNCGTELPEGAEFCPRCGTPVEREENVNPAGSPSPAPSVPDAAGAEDSQTSSETVDTPNPEPSSTSADTASTPEPKKAKRKPSKRTWIILASVLAVLIAAGVVIGVVASHNRSKQAVTRYDWIQMLDQQAGISYDTKAKHKQQFSDVAPDSRYYKAVQAAYEAGLLSKDKTFHGDDPATEEFVGVTGMKSIRKAAEETSSRSSDSLTDEQYYELAKKNGIAGKSRNRKVEKTECQKRLKIIFVVLNQDQTRRQVVTKLKLAETPLQWDSTLKYDWEKKTVTIRGKQTGPDGLGDTFEGLNPGVAFLNSDMLKQHPDLLALCIGLSSPSINNALIYAYNPLILSGQIQTIKFMPVEEDFQDNLDPSKINHYTDTGSAQIQFTVKKNKLVSYVTTEKLSSKDSTYRSETKFTYDSDGHLTGYTTTGKDVGEDWCKIQYENGVPVQIRKNPIFQIHDENDVYILKYQDHKLRQIDYGNSESDRHKVYTVSFNSDGSVKALKADEADNDSVLFDYNSRKHLISISNNQVSGIQRKISFTRQEGQ